MNAPARDAQLLDFVRAGLKPAVAAAQAPKPLALSKLIIALDQQGDKAEADQYRQQLKSEFPEWKAP